MTNNFVQTWGKYLPVIKILMKRAANEKQSLEMNSMDFQRAVAGKKTKFSFSIWLVKGRAKNILTPSLIAKDLVTVLEQDLASRTLMKQQEFEFTMNNDFILMIKNCTTPVEANEEAAQQPANDPMAAKDEETKKDE